MIFKTIGDLFSDEDPYVINVKYGAVKGEAKVYILDPREEPYENVPYMYRVPKSSDTCYVVDVIVLYNDGHFTSLSDKKVINNQITITKEKHIIELPSWSNISKLKAIEYFKSQSNDS